MYDFYRQISGESEPSAQRSFSKHKRRSRYLEFEFTRAVKIPELEDDIFELVKRLPLNPRTKSAETETRKTSGPSQMRLKQTYLNLIRRKIARHKHYPEYDREMENEGETGLKFIVMRNGRIRALRLIKQTPYSGLNKAALAAVRNASPLPPLPAELPDEIVVSLELHFKE